MSASARLVASASTCANTWPANRSAQWVQQDVLMGLAEAGSAYDPHGRQVELDDQVIRQRTDVGPAVDLAVDLPLVGTEVLRSRRD